MDYKRLKVYLDANAATFAALSDTDAAIEMNVVDKPYNVPVMSGKQVKDAFEGNAAEWTLLSDAQQQTILALCARDDLNPHGVDADIFTDACAGQCPNTLAALNTARTLTKSRAEIEGFGQVLASHIAVARAL